MRKKMFLTLFCGLSIIFFISYCLIYIIFRSTLMNEIEQKQANLLAFNETIFTNYVDSFNMVPFQLINDEEFGKALNTDSPVYLKMFRAKVLIRKKFEKYLNQLLYSSSITCSFTFYLQKSIPLANYFDSQTLSDNSEMLTSQVYSTEAISQEEWYQRTMSVTWSPYFFLNEHTDELCYAKCIQNYYQQKPSKEGIGVIIIRIPVDSLFDKLSLESITPHSSIFLINEDDKILYQSGEPIENILTSDLTACGNERYSRTMKLASKKYIINTVSVNDDLFLTLLTPFSDIEAMARHSLRTYIWFSIFTYLIVILILYVISKKITAPVISFAHLMGKVEDSRTFDISRLSEFRDAELQVLCNSFLELIHRENTLIEQIYEENRAKRAAVLHALQAQINPHFLYNALDVVSWMALSRKNDDIADVISSIANLMHYSISHPDDTVSLRKELDNIQEFIRIYQLECPIEIQLNILVPDETILLQIQIPKFILQPLIENAILHNPDITSLLIEVHIKQSPEQLSITVIDNGSGADPEKLNAFLCYEETDLKVSNGFGIRNVNERIQLHYSNNSCLSYKKDLDGRLMAIITLFYP
ncbi:sensor histidine kinase [Anaerocolumna sp. MB42-C2]|uniref:sensor histidine kinase n=1 Tax=Anaerocolumna sp. MB42-C2 TaxID=3070997 RepID=UPI0027DEAFD7|nr:histidine kinase [Anaerocolumna sp. MB42-C2]WMJ88992.1 histidine kinase [Anaerocolumna sp. MB42-C2]